MYSAIVNKGTCARFAFAAAIFGDIQEALFWLQLPQALHHYLDKSTSRSSEKGSESSVHYHSEQASTLNRASSSTERSAPENMAKVAEVIIKSDVCNFRPTYIYLLLNLVVSPLYRIVDN